MTKTAIAFKINHPYAEVGDIIHLTPDEIVGSIRRIKIAYISDYKYIFGYAHSEKSEEG